MTPTSAPPDPALVRTSGAVAAQRTIAVVGDVWSLRLLRSVFRGRRRHGDFVAELGISRAVLSDRLARLVEHDVLLRHALPGRHPEYRLTERGLDLWSLFLAMWQWEADWSQWDDAQSWAIDRPRPQVRHTECGQVMRPQLRCGACGDAVLPFDTRAGPGEAEAEPGAHVCAGDGAISQPAALAGSTARPTPDSAFRRGRGAQREQGTALAQVVGDRWSAAVVAAAFRGARQFAQFRQQIGIGPAQLSGRLVELQGLGLLRARRYAGSRQEYRLTRAGIALFPMTLELLRWGNRWLAGPGEDYPVQHLPCGQPLHARWHCDQCGEELKRETVSFG
ncbi:MAG: helix-turn-helix transcriptional regulator [Burkholderiales bacterium]|nr:helix-turn-helix transcriptional regulator [Burkholderiales bacterium]